MDGNTSLSLCVSVQECLALAALAGARDAEMISFNSHLKRNERNMLYLLSSYLPHMLDVCW